MHIKRPVEFHQSPHSAVSLHTQLWQPCASSFGHASEVYPYEMWSRNLLSYTTATPWRFATIPTQSTNHALSLTRFVSNCLQPSVFLAPALSKPEARCFQWRASAEWHIRFAFGLDQGDCFSLIPTASSHSDAEPELTGDSLEVSKSPHRVGVS